jgi:hypothetical protein
VGWPLGGNEVSRTRFWLTRVLPATAAVLAVVVVAAFVVKARPGAPAPAGEAGPGRDRAQGLGRDRAQGLSWDGLPGLNRARLPGLDRALRGWAGRLGEAPAEPDLDAWRRAGIRLVCPGDTGIESQHV